MYVLCSICRDAFTGEGNETIYSTSCGHVFHHQCLTQWLQRVKTCPHCRMKIPSNKMFKLNLYFEGTAGPRTGVENAQQENLQFTLSMKNIELQQLRETTRIATEQAKGLKLEVKKLEQELKNSQSNECTLLHDIRKLKQELKLERQKNQRFGGSTHAEHIPFDVIDLDDSDPELLLDIDANLQQMRRNTPNQEPEVIDLDDSVTMNNTESNQEIQDLKSQLEMKEILLASAFARITELEKHNALMLHGCRNEDST